MSAQRRNDRWPRYDWRRRHDTTAPFVRCPSCGFTASVVTAPGHPVVSPWERLRLLLESDCLGCPECPGDLDISLPATRPREAPAHLG